MSIAVNYDDVIRQLDAFGLDTAKFKVGCLVRCRTPDDHGGQKSGWYSLFEIQSEAGEFLIVGAFGDWRAGGAHKIELERKRELSGDERAAIRKRISAERKKAEAARKQKAAEVAFRASRMWRDQCQPATEHDYLTRKQVDAHGVRVSRKGALVVPMCDTFGAIHGLQLILSREHHAAAIKKIGRDKTFHPSGLAKRGHFHMLGAPKPGGVMLIAEGYATAASLHEATGLPCAVAFDAGNLEPVAEALAKHYKRLRILICADDDYLGKCRACGKFTEVADPDCRHCGHPHGKSNTGVSKAATAAMAVSGAYLAPTFADRGTKKLTDWNDLSGIEGAHQLRSQLESKLTELSWDALPVKVRQRGNPDRGAGKADVPSFISVDEACERYSLIYGVKDTMFDHVLFKMIPKSCVMDIMPDHGWREMKTRADRRVVDIDAVGFDPSESDERIRCNMWGGWPTTPDTTGTCDRLIELLEYMCSADEHPRDAFKWMMRWLAYPIQHPGAKMKTALVVHGGQGVGKNLFFEAVMAIYGDYGRVVGQGDIEDRFNDWASRKLFLIANEVMARQDLFHQKNKMKALITDDWIRINPKNVAAHDERNHINLVFMSNEAQPVVVDRDDRRVFVIRTPKKKEQEFYNAVLDEIANGGIAALHHHLLNLPLGDFSPGTPPLETRARKDLIELSKESPDRFIEAWLRGELDAACQACALADIYKLYDRWCRTEGERFAYAKNKFSARIGTHDELSVQRKPVLKGSGKPKVMSVLLPADDQKPDGDTWMAWLGKRVRDFHNDVEDKDAP